MMTIILIVDDDLALLEALPPMIRYRLANVDFETTESPEEALHLVATKHYGAVLSDVNLPRIGGLDLLRRIRALRPTTPVIMMTGHGDDTVRRSALSAGAVGFLEKPFDRDEVVRQLQDALGRQEPV